MPLLTFVDAGGQEQTVRFAETDEIRIGTESGWSNVQLPPDLGVQPRHAVIMRSVLNRLLVLVDLAGKKTWVNRHPVVKVRVLRQGDTVQVGHCALGVAEVQITRLKAGDPAVGQKCPVSRRTLAAGDEVIACPGCRTIHEREAWFLIERCAAGCGYPNRSVILDTLPSWLQIERDLDEESSLIEQIENGRVLRDGESCQAGQARDQVPFQPGQNAVYCPSCRSPFHLECFLTLPACPVCSYDIASLVNTAFLAESAPDE